MNPAAPPPEAPENGFSDADRAWFEQLAGRAAPESDVHAQAVAEARALSKALAEQQHRVDANEHLRTALAPGRTEAQLQALLVGLRRDQLLPLDAATRPRWSRWKPVLGMSMAAALAAFLVVPLLQIEGPAYDEPPGYRGDLVEIQRIDAKPRAAAEAMAVRLKAAGANAQIYQRGSTLYVDIDVPADLADALKKALQADNLPVTPGLVRVRFVES